MTEDQKKELQAKVEEWRAESEPVGPQHALWEAIFDAEALLAGRPAFLPVEQLLRIK